MADASAVFTPAQVLEPFYARPAFLFARIDQICTALYTELAVDAETLTQAEFLLVLQALPGLDQITLSRATGVDKSTVALVVDTLEQRGLITRTPDPADGRRLRLQPTRRAGMLTPRVAAAYGALQAKLAEPFKPAELTFLRSILLPLAANPMSLAPRWQTQPPDDMEQGNSGQGGGDLSSSLSFLCRRGLQVSHAQFLDCTAE
ncbi:MAG: MarR family transcriptional regulator, partial [Spongiibacteraceae bacterium]|nr:MarR family transcriptional regulator [Spongiibacteraceae bacterium]